MAQKVNSPVVEAILAQYEKGNEKKSTSNAKKSFDLKNYFTTFLPEGVKDGSKTVRILPGIDGGTPFVPVFVHSKMIKGKSEKFLCPNKHLDKDCPFCEVKAELYSTKQESDRLVANTLNTKDMYVVRVIDRDHEEEGIKFWRISVDCFKQLIGIIKVRGDISDLESGRDIILNLGKVSKGNGKPYTEIISMIDCDSAPAFETKEQYNTYSEDKRTWNDVYSVKPYGYLEIIVKGGEPVWSKEKECYVDKSESQPKQQSEYNEPIVMGNDAKKQAVKQEVKTATPTVEAEDDDNLPF